MVKKQKVKFFRGDKRPGNQNVQTLHYRKKMIKRGKEFIWQVIEQPHNKVVAEYFFEEDAQKIVSFQNKHKVWQSQGGIPEFLYINISK